MTHGMPDYNRDVRLKYGGGVEFSGYLDVAPNILNSFGIIYGKGMIYGGTVWLDYTSSQANSEVTVIMDGMGTWGLSFIRMIQYGVLKPRNSLVSLNVFDGTQYIYSVGISYGITFESSFKLCYYEKHGDTPRVHYRLSYALI